MKKLLAQIYEWLYSQVKSNIRSIRWLSITAFIAVQVAFIITGFTITVPFEKGTSLWSQIPWAAIAQLFVGAGAVTVAYITFIRTREQNQEHFNRQEQENQFKDILDRLASDRPELRANAVIRLAEMAENKYLTHTGGSLISVYPYFHKVVSQLASALHMEQNGAVRKEIVKAFKRLAMAAKNQQELLCLLINEIADANRQAFVTFIDYLSQYLTSFEESLEYEQINDGHLRAITPFAFFCDDNELNVICLRDIVKSEEFIAAYNRCYLIKSNRSSNPEDSINSMLCKLQLQTSVLIDTRQAIQASLNELKAPDEFPSDPEKGLWRDNEIWGRRQKLDLSKCFLPGMTLFDAHLEGVHFIKALLQNATFYRANLDLAVMFFCELEYSKLDDCIMRGAEMSGASLQYASFMRANLEGAKLAKAKAWGANFDGANLKDAYLKDIVFENTENVNDVSADFSNTNWWEARLTNDTNDNTLETWLSQQFPKRDDIAGEEVV